MALEISYTHDNGTTYSESYWRISKVVSDFTTPRFYLCVLGYENSAAREAGEEPIDFKNYYMGELQLGEETIPDVTIEDFSTAMDAGNRPVLYGYLKNNISFFENSENC